MNLRKLAKGQPCQVRLVGTCNANRDTTVLAHVRLAGISGAGLKSPDVLGAWCCSSCHEVTEKEKVDDWIQRCFYEGVIRTQNELVTMGVLEW